MSPTDTLSSIILFCMGLLAASVIFILALGVFGFLGAGVVRTVRAVGLRRIRNGILAIFVLGAALFCAHAQADSSRRAFAQSINESGEAQGWVWAKDGDIFAVEAERGTSYAGVKDILAQLCDNEPAHVSVRQSLIRRGFKSIEVNAETDGELNQATRELK